jgi:hypothetical protein
MPTPSDHDPRYAAYLEARRQSEQPSLLSHEIDMEVIFEWLDSIERRLARLEGMTENVAAIRGDLDMIAEGVNPALTAHVAGLTAKVENHGLLLAKLLDGDAKAGGQ